MLLQSIDSTRDSRYLQIPLLIACGGWSLEGQIRGVLSACY